MKKPGFTLIELLVVIAIIGILVALLLPGVQAAREAARQVRCTNNLKQQSLACQLHSDTYSRLPANGWNWRWTADPNRGIGSNQSGGWLYNILPHMEEEYLYELGTSMTGNALRDAKTERIKTVVPTFVCPSRDGSGGVQYIGWGLYDSSIQNGDIMGRADYAGNSGSDPAGIASYRSVDTTGVFIATSSGGFDGVRFADITDGLSATYLVGERYINADQYRNGQNPGNDQGWTTGNDPDVLRWTQNNRVYAPRRDRRGITNRNIFGSAHDAGFNISMCDGSVRRTSYTIDIEVHYLLGNRYDGEPVSIGL